jgi:poly-gamma-glutamate synthesis protein (capsule biosynthesis protein)
MPASPPWERRPGDAILLLVGDTNLQHRADPATAFQHVRPMLDQADIRFAHLEGPLTQSTTASGTPDIPHKPRWLHSDPRMVDGLVAAGIHAVSLASNVTHPRKAGVDTAAVLDRVGIAHAGVGRTLAEARKPAIVERAGVRVGFLSYASVFWPYEHVATETDAGCATLKAHTAYQPGRRTLEMPGAEPTIVTWPDDGELAEMVRDIKALRPNVDVIALSCHWGISSALVPADYQRAIARAAFAAGADLILGHHSHTVQGIEVITGKPVFYSAGNFAFDWTVMQGRHLEGIAVEVLIRDRAVAGWRCRLVRRNPSNDVAPLDPASADGQALIAQIRDLSAAFGTTLTLVGDCLYPVAT